jgi:HAD superfamily hydrolase (TIGR01490 family)
MRYAYSFLRGKSVEEVALWIDDFFEKQLKHFVYSDAVEVIHEHQNLGRTVILVSNAMEPIVKKLAAYLDVDNYISTTLEVIDGHYTGNIIDMVYGDNKAAAVERFVDNNSLGLETAWAYADHVSDEPILTRVRHPYVVNASRSLLTFARQNQWPSLTFEKLTK